MMKTAFQFLRPIVSAGALAALPLTGLGAAPIVAAVPELSLSLSGVTDDSLEQGEPLRVTVRLESSGEGSGSVELAPSVGTWVDAIAVELSAVGKSTVVARAGSVGAPESPRATLDRGRVAGGVWIFSASSTQGLSPGNYIVRARLAIKGGAGWSGEVTSDDVPLSVIGVSSLPERISARTLVHARIAFSGNAFEESARILDGELAKTPDDVELLSLRADVALRGGNPLAAMICVSRATRALSPNASGPPPLMLHDVRARVLAARLAGTAPPANPPAWTWPPTSVLTLPEKEAAALREMAAPKPGAAPTAGATQAPVAAPAAKAPGNISPASAPLLVTPTPRNSAAAIPSLSGAVSIGKVVPSAELSPAKILADAAGQWAASARAGSEYGRTQYSAAKVVGAPNVPVVGNSPDAWCPASKDKGTDWLEVTFAKPVQAIEVRVRQSDAAGAIAKVEAIEPDGTAHVWWEGIDPHQPPAVRDVAWFVVRVPQTSYLVARVKLTLNLASGPGWKQIDAVQLVAASREGG